MVVFSLVNPTYLLGLWRRPSVFRAAAVERRVLQAVKRSGKLNSQRIRPACHAADDEVCCLCLFCSLLQGRETS